MIKLTQLTLHQGTAHLLDEASLEIYPQQKVALIGRNGCGKSTLFSLIQGKIQPDQGSCSLPAQWVIAHVMQETPALAISAIDYVKSGDPELIQLEQELELESNQNDPFKLAHLHERYGAIEGYRAEARAAELLHGLGFHANEMKKTVAEFSGGWRVRLNLARALMCRSDLLLLDEPTNHLDLDAVIWLEQWLKHYSGTLLLISHDRDFINATVQYITHFDRKKLVFYRGDYDQFEEQRTMKLSLQQSAYEKQQHAITHLESFINRFKAKASKAKQAQSRVKALDKMVRLTAAHADSEFQFHFKAPDANPTPLLHVQRVALGYGEHIVFPHLDFSMTPGMRLALLGPNGAGKSTLIKLLAGVLEPLKGECSSHPKLKIGYFTQHQIDHLDLNASPLLHLQRLDPKITEQQARAYLGQYAFTSDKTLQAVKGFSGGEKARLALALIVYQRPNLLLLDEPTNHLDMDMRAALTLALQEYEGGLVLVSHDRYLLRSTTDECWLVADGKALSFDGDLDDYEKWLRHYKRETLAQKAPPLAKSTPLPIKKNEHKIVTIEKQLAEVAAKLRQIESSLADPTIYQSHRATELKALLAEQEKYRVEQAKMEEQYLILIE